jgi:hypothetical protein
VDNQVVPFEQLSHADLHIETIYKGGVVGNAGDDPLSKLMGVNNQGGFRFKRDPISKIYTLAVLYSSNADPDWPDYLDASTGLFTYYGDNKKPGSRLEETHKGGNRLLHKAFEYAHGDEPTRRKVPPFFVFTKASEGRDVIFRGLAVPGGVSIPQTEDLVAIWKIKDGQRFQNYRAIFTILDVARISRQWLIDIQRGNIMSKNCPSVYADWVRAGRYNPLKATTTIKYRTREQQLPDKGHEEALLTLILQHYANDPFGFERFAAEIVKMMDKNVMGIELTRPVVDGGRDGIGLYRLGSPNDPIFIDFALEAKCYAFSNSVGVKEVSRLISRLKYRQFGVLVTTSYVASQAYREIREDGHPIIILAARDIANILIANGLGNLADLRIWLEINFL